MDNMVNMFHNKNFYTFHNKKYLYMFKKLLLII